MNAQLEPQLSPMARAFLEETPMKSLLGISDTTLDAVMALAYQLHRAGRNSETVILCRGLIAADHTYWWSYSLYAAALRQLGQPDEALAQLERGLAYAPRQPRLLAMHASIRQALNPATAPRAAA